MILRIIKWLEHSDFQCTRVQIDALVAFKDRIVVSDIDWPYVCELFRLPSEQSIYHIKKRKGELNKQGHPTRVSMTNNKMERRGEGRGGEGRGEERRGKERRGEREGKREGKRTEQEIKKQN